ncbi:fumarylacetoacetate hydrolase family protein [Phenylobacterium immobile]|uniref:fumarylacetoacetate hydrolase family protein n=1 Tax=Phenylobacterium immobile TaxID=21 RepID=UPI000A8E695E|nr:fumarylacetoacetate hydrolase family protein [Phenylobacterium immobile]
MKRARIALNGRAVWGVVDNDAVVLPGGRAVALANAHFLPPVTPGASIFALGLNYADHSVELGFKPPSAPLIFLKGPNTLVGHDAVSPRPADANQMHPECELVAIIGRPARKVRQADALDYVGGYTVTCDYAIREYLENYYRPNLRVKNRDATTPIGPWIVDAADVGDPQALALSSSVNGNVVQHGSTADMVFPVAELIAYLSDFMTLMPGDMIMTGTPHGVHFVQGGDEVVCEIEKVGRLVNRVEAE